MVYAVETAELSKRFGAQWAVQDLALQVLPGAVYGLLGPNGAGKTTTLKMLVGLLRPHRGRVRLFGEPWRREHLARVGSLIEGPGLYGHLTGSENLEVHTALLGLPKSAIGEVLAQVGLEGVGKKRVAAYSQGMKQRLGVAIALLGRPELMILDEPSNGLDPVGIREMRAMIQDFGRQGITVIVSSHILAEVAQVVSHIGVLSAGRLRYQGTLEGLLAQGRSQLQIETPQAEQALTWLRGRYQGVRCEGSCLTVPVGETEAAGVVAGLAAQGIVVTRMTYHGEDLEAQFMRLIGPESR